MKRLEFNFGKYTKLIILASVLLLFSFLGDYFSRLTRIDLTEDALYSLSEGSRKILSSIHEDRPIKLILFFSSQEAKQVTQLAGLSAYATRVQRFLNEYVIASSGRLTLELVHPEPFSEEEDRAVEYGLQPVPLNRTVGSKLFFGLVAEDSEGHRANVGFLQQEKERFLEYDVTKLIYRVMHPDLPKIGLLSAEKKSMYPPQGRSDNFIFQQLKQLYEVVKLDTDLSQLSKIDHGISVIMLVQPKLTEAAVYLLDQFVLKGGRLILFMDPLVGEFNIMNAAQATDTDAEPMSKLLTNWGVEFNTDQIILDAKYAVTISRRNGGIVRHPGYLGISGDGISDTDVVMSKLDKLMLGTVGSIQQHEGAQMTFEPLLRSSQSATTKNVKDVDYGSFSSQDANPSHLLRGAQYADEAFVIAARLSGQAETAFPKAWQKADQAEKQDDKLSSFSVKNHTKVSSDPVQVVLVADSDILTDRFWVHVRDFFGRRIATQFSDNGNFVLNLVEHLSGGVHLMGIRGRGQLDRAFSKVDDYREEARQRYAQHEERLEGALAETEKKLLELQQKQPSSNAGAQQPAVVLTPEQRKAILDFQSKKLEIRKQLREVRHNLDKDIQKLGTHLKLLNIFLAPLLLLVIMMVSIMVYNRFSVRRFRQKIAGLLD